MNNNRNLVAFVVLSALLLMGWQYFVAAPQLQAEQARQALGGQVFDVLGKLQFEGKSLRERLLSASTAWW